jgi:hypothetical protein
MRWHGIPHFVFPCSATHCTRSVCTLPDSEDRGFPCRTRTHELSFQALDYASQMKFQSRATEILPEIEALTFVCIVAYRESDSVRVVWKTSARTVNSSGRLNRNRNRKTRERRRDELEANPEGKAVETCARGRRYFF